MRKSSAVSAALTAFLAIGILLSRPADASAAQLDVSAALPIPISLQEIVAGSDVPMEALRGLEGAVTGAMPVAGFASIGRSPLSLTIHVTSRTRGQSDAGMRRVVLRDVTVTLTIRGSTTAGVLASRQMTGSGTGRDESMANEVALAGIAGNQAGLDSTFRELHRQASLGYELLCDDLHRAASDLAQRREFDAAIALLMSVPPAASRCRARAQAASRATYTQRGSWQCGSALQRARAAEAAGALNAALDEVRFVDPLSPCRAEVGQLIDRVGRAAAARNARVEAERAELLRREWAHRFRALEAATSIEQQRLAVIGQIARNFFLVVP